MSKEGVALFLGRACIDVEFRELFKKDLDAAVKNAAAKDVRVTLDQKELAELKRLQCHKELESLQDCLKHHHKGVIYSFGP